MPRKKASQLMRFYIKILRSNGKQQQKSVPLSDPPGAGRTPKPGRLRPPAALWRSAGAPAVPTHTRNRETGAVTLGSRESLPCNHENQNKHLPSDHWQAHTHRSFELLLLSRLVLISEFPEIAPLKTHARRRTRGDDVPSAAYIAGFSWKTLTPNDLSLKGILRRQSNFPFCGCHSDRPLERLGEK